MLLTLFRFWPLSLFLSLCPISSRTRFYAISCLGLPAACTFHNSMWVFLIGCGGLRGGVSVVGLLMGSLAW